MSFTLHLVSVDDNLGAICSQMQPDKWGKDNEMTRYDPERLRRFSEDGGVLLLAYVGEVIAGVAIAYVLLHPAGEDSLYVHELDTHPNYRRQGVATALMRELMKIAREKKLREVWVGTEMDNRANDFYKSLAPDEAEPSVIYAYKVK